MTATSTTQYIMTLLHWSLDEFTEFQMRAGVEFLSWFYYRDKELQEQLLRSKLFWDEFKANWEARDQSWINELMEDEDLWHKSLQSELHSDVFESYMSTHCIQHMRECPSPSSMDKIMKEVLEHIHR